MHYTYIFRTFLAVCFALFFVSVHGQIKRQTYYPESQPGVINYVFDDIKVEDGLIISTRQSTSSGQAPVLIKIDKNGNIVWSCKNNAFPATSICNSFNIELFEDGYIYGTSNQETSSRKYNIFWKVNAITGEAEWQKISSVNNSYKIDLAEYDTATFVAAYINAQMMTTIAIMDKNNGDTITTKSFSNDGNPQNVAVDYNKNIYYSQGNSLTKFSLNKLDFPIWKRQYNERKKEMDVIHELFIDKYDDIYLFGRDGATFNHGNGIIIKANSSTGFMDWHLLASGGDVALADFVDFNGFIYATYRHTLFGGGNYFFQTAKVNKSSGSTAWVSYRNVNPLGAKASYSGSSEAALGLDVDCKGDMYLTGYYGATSYGPGAWGIMKVKNGDGTKAYDLTITEDSAFYDENSTGRITAVFGDTVIFIGQLDVAKGKTEHFFVSLNAATGSIIKRSSLGEDYQSLSVTADIINHNDSLYVLKQQGRFVIAEQYDRNSNLLWKKTFYTNGMLQAGQIKVADDALYLTAYKVLSDSFSNNKTASTESLFFYKLNAANGNILSSDTMHFTSSVVVPFELEADSNAAYVFYYKDKSVYYLKWSNTGLSSAHLLETAGKNMNYKGKLNIAVNESATSLLYAGTNDIFTINKSTLAKTSVFSHSAQSFYFDHLIIGDTLYLAGSSNTNKQLITAINLNNKSLAWDETYAATGALYNIVADTFKNLYAAGTSRSTTTIHQVSSSTGSLKWTNYEDTLLYPATIPYSLEVHRKNNYLALAGANIRPGGSTDAVIRLIDLKGKQLFSYIGKDEINANSQANTIALAGDSIWIGGSLNRKSYPKQGFIYVLYHPFVNYCNSSYTSANISACKQYVSPSGNFVWRRSAIYTDTLAGANGCDSIITINLTINDVDNSVTTSQNILMANDSNATYQWLDCNNGYTPVPGAINRVFTASQSGSYAVKVTNGSCVDTSACYPVIVTGLEEIRAELNDIKVYPNPTSGIVNIEGIKGSYTYIISDVLGKESIIQNASANQLDLSNRKAGIYLLKIISGNQQKVFKIVKLK